VDDMITIGDDGIENLTLRKNWLPNLK